MPNSSRSSSSSPSSAVVGDLRLAARGELLKGSYWTSSYELSLEAVELEFEMPGTEPAELTEESLRLFQGSLGMAGGAGWLELVDGRELPTVGKYEPLCGCASEGEATPPVANFGVPSGEALKAHNVGLGSIGVPSGVP